jgi:hypothetical protein
MILASRSDVLNGARSFISPIHEDSDASLLVQLHRQGVLPSEWRDHLVGKLMSALDDSADPSIFKMNYIDDVLTEAEKVAAIGLARESVLTNIPKYVRDLKSEWSGDYPPDEHFDTLEASLETIGKAVVNAVPAAEVATPMNILQREVRRAVDDMGQEYEPPSSTAAPVAASTPQSAVLQSLFRDIDE